MDKARHITAHILALILFALIVLTVALKAHAQAACADPSGWCVSVAKTATVVRPTGALNVTVTFTSVVAATNVTLDTEIYDSTGVKVTGGQSWQTGVNFTPGQTVVANLVSYQVPDTGPVGTYTIAAGVFTSANAQLFFKQGVDSFLVGKGNPPPCYPPKYNILKPLVVPHVANGDIPVSVGSARTSFVAYVCDMGTGYITTVTLYRKDDSSLFSMAWDYMFGALTAAQAAADCIATCGTMSATEQTFADGVTAQYQPKATVMLNGATKTRVVFFRNADGTLGAQAPDNDRIHVNTPCIPWKRIAGTAFYSVQGQPDSTHPGVSLGDVYAQCTVVLPIGSNPAN